MPPVQVCIRAHGVNTAAAKAFGGMDVRGSVKRSESIRQQAAKAGPVRPCYSLFH